MTRTGWPILRAPARACAVGLLAAALPVLFGLAVSPAAVHAAGPSPATSPAASPGVQHDTNDEVWFDEPLPPDIPAGRSVAIGFTIWDRAAQAMSQLNQVEVRVHPAAGKAAPTQAHARSDWPGHLGATITIPKGGLGVIDVGLLGQVCRDDGSCTDEFLAMTIGGIGPPPDAKLSTLLEATIVPPLGSVAAGRPIALDALARPRAPWDPTTVPLPDHLVLNATNVRGEELATAELAAVRSEAGRYHGVITIAQPGDVALVLAVPAERGVDEVLDGTRIQLKLVDGGSGQAGAPVTVPGTEDSLPILPIVAGAAIVILASLVIRRVFADL